MTLAPRSASWRVVNGAATACSSETTVMPSRGSVPATSDRPRKAVLGEAGGYEVRGEQGYPVQPGLAELPLRIVLRIQPVPPEGQHRRVDCLPQRVRRRRFRRVHRAPRLSSGYLRLPRPCKKI